MGAHCCLPVQDLFLQAPKAGEKAAIKSDAGRAHNASGDVSSGEKAPTDYNNNNHSNSRNTGTSIPASASASERKHKGKSGSESRPNDPSRTTRSGWTSLERLVADVWDKTLGAPGTTTSLNENFGELGGESLLALRACAALRYELKGEVKTTTEDDAPEFGMLGGPFAPASLLAAPSLREYCAMLRAQGLDYVGGGGGDPPSAALALAPTPAAASSSTSVPTWPSVRAAARDCTPGAGERLAALLDAIPEESLKQQWCGLGVRKGAKSNLNFTALHASAKAGAIECLDLLLALRARPTVAEPGSGMTALHYAAMSESDLALKRLLSAPGAALPVRDARGQSLFHAAARAGAVAPLKLLLETLQRSQLDPSDPNPDADENSPEPEAHGPGTPGNLENPKNPESPGNPGNPGNLGNLGNPGKSGGRAGAKNGPRPGKNGGKLRSLRADEGRRGLLEWTDRWARTAVHWGALNGHVEAIKLLLDGRADPAPVQISSHQMAKRTHLSQEQPLELALRVHGADSEVAALLRASIERRKKEEGSKETDQTDLLGAQPKTDMFAMGDVQFLLTLGSELGLDRLALWELKERLGAQHVQRVKCRLYFSAPTASPIQFSALKSAEKLCAVVGLHEAVVISSVLDAAEGGAEETDEEEVEGLKERALADWIASSSSWETVMSAWTLFNESLQPAGSHPVTGNADSPLTFKVTCRRSGKRFRHVSTQRLAVATASSLTKRFGWRAQVRNPDFEVRVLISDSEVLIDVPILVQLSVPIGGGELVSSGLAAPVAWAMARSAELQPGDRVLDPMCGKAITLIEASLCWTKCHYLGIDIDSQQLLGASENSRLLLEAAGRTSAAKLELMQGDARCLPLPNDCVDAILCDVPFGKQFLTLEECRNGLYDQVLDEFDRVVVKSPQGRVVLLSSLEQELWLLRSAGFDVDGLPPRPIPPTKTNSESRIRWRCICRREVKLGPLEAVLIVLHRPESSLALAQVDQGAGPDAHSLPPLSKRLWWEGSGGRGDWASLKIADRPPMQLARGREI